MTLTEYLAAGSFPPNVSEMPNSWSPAWADALSAKLAETHPTARRVKTGDEAKITQVGLDAAMGNSNATVFLDLLKAYAQGVIAAADAMPETTPQEVQAKQTTHYTGRTLLRQWSIVTGDAEGEKGFYEYSNPATRAGFDLLCTIDVGGGRMLLTGGATPTVQDGVVTNPDEVRSDGQRKQIHDFWTEPMTRAEAAGLASPPTARQIRDTLVAMPDSGWSIPVLPTTRGGGA